MALLDRVQQPAGTPQPTSPKTQQPQPTRALNPDPSLNPDGGHVAGPSARLPGIVRRSGVLGRMARTRGMQYANERGLVNSSIGADASHRALLDYAVPLASADTNTALANRAEDLAGERHQAELDLRRYGIDEETARHAVDAAFREKELGARSERRDPSRFRLAGTAKPDADRRGEPAPHRHSCVPAPPEHLSGHRKHPGEP